MDGFIFPAPFAGAVTLISVLALGYVWLSCVQESLGREIKALEVAKKELCTKCEHAQSVWAGMKAPCSLEAHLARHGMSMDWPSRRQIVRLRHADVSGQESHMTLDGSPAYAKLERTFMHE